MTHKTAKINFITSRTVDIMRCTYYIDGPWGDENIFCCFMCVTQRWALSPIYSGTTQLNSTQLDVELSWVELSWVVVRYKHCYIPVYIAEQLKWVELSCKSAFIAEQLNSTQLDVQLSWVELFRYKWGFGASSSSSSSPFSDHGLIVDVSHRIFHSRLKTFLFSKFFHP